MTKKLALFVLVFCVSLITGGWVLSKQGKHIGEQKMLDVAIEFINSFGKTVTNADGVFYYYNGRLIGSEDKVYPPQYQGEFALYFFGSPAGITVTITNKGPQAKAKLRIKTESYVLNTDGSSGVALMTPKVIDVEIPRGETKTIDASFVVEYIPGAESGLDRFLVKVLHMNKGGGKGNMEPALIMSKEGIFCPPEYAAK